MYNNVLLDLHFPLVVYKKLLHDDYQPKLEDLAETNAVRLVQSIIDKHPLTLYQALTHGLRQLLSYQGDVNDLELNYQITFDYYGAKMTHDLIENGVRSFVQKPLLTHTGANIPVTTENRLDYVERYVRYLLSSSIDAQVRTCLDFYSA